MPTYNSANHSSGLIHNRGNRRINNNINKQINITETAYLIVLKVTWNETISSGYKLINYTAVTSKFTVGWVFPRPQSDHAGCEWQLVRGRTFACKTYLRTRAQRRLAEEGTDTGGNRYAQKHKHTIAYAKTQWLKIVVINNGRRGTKGQWRRRRETRASNTERIS